MLPHLAQPSYHMVYSINNFYEPAPSCWNHTLPIRHLGTHFPSLFSACNCIKTFKKRARQPGYNITSWLYGDIKRLDAGCVLGGLAAFHFFEINKRKVKKCINYLHLIIYKLSYMDNYLDHKWTKLNSSFLLSCLFAELCDCRTKYDIFTVFCHF